VESLCCAGRGEGIAALLEDEDPLAWCADGIAGAGVSKGVRRITEAGLTCGGRGGGGGMCSDAAAESESRASGGAASPSDFNTTVLGPLVVAAAALAGEASSGGSADEAGSGAARVDAAWAVLSSGVLGSVESVLVAALEDCTVGFCGGIGGAPFG